DDYLHILDLDAVVDDPDRWDPAARTSLVDDPTAPLDDREVLVTPDGDWAVIRRLSVPRLTLVEIGSGDQVVVDLSGAPTDVDLTNNGAGVLAVVRETAELVLFDIPADAQAEIVPTVVQSPMDIPIGQALLRPGGTQAIVFSTAADRATTGQPDLSSATLDTWRLGSGKSIAGAALSPTGDRVFIQHLSQPESMNPVERLHGFSILEFETEENDGRPFDKLFQTDADISGLVFTRDGQH